MSNAANNREVEDVLRTIVKEIVLAANYARSRIKYKTSTPPTGAADGAKPTTADTKAPAQVQAPAPPYRITETLAAFIVRAIVMNPANGFDISAPLPKPEIERLIKTCVERIIRTDDQAFETIKMQVYFDTNYPVQLDFLRAEKQSRVQESHKLVSEIHETKAKSVSVIEGLYRKVVSYILMMSSSSSTGSADLGVARETSAALESVFPAAELPAFINMTENEKEVQLTGLVQLVSGIRLFNRHLGKGGAGIDNLPAHCDAELKDGLATIDQLNYDSGIQIQNYTSVIDYFATTEGTAFAASYSTDIVEKIKRALIFHRQLRLFLSAVHEQLVASREALQSVNEKYEAAIRDLKQACRSKSAVPVDQVYPHFMNLATVWTSYRDTLFLLALRQGILETLDYFVRESDRRYSVPVEILASIEASRARGVVTLRSVDPEPKLDADIVKTASALMADMTFINSKIDILHPGNSNATTIGTLPTANKPVLGTDFSTPVKLTVQGELYRRLILEYAGFCPLTLVRTGVLVPGNWNNGLLRYKDKLYAFETVEKAKEWARDPDQYIETLLNRVSKERPDLVQLLHLYQYIPIVDNVESAKTKARHKLLMTALRLNQPQKTDSSCQTGTHILYDGHSHIDNAYHWNEWDLRRQAILLVNLKKKLTHSTQTDVSHFRKEVSVQCYRHGKQTGTQTRRDGATTMPKRVNFIKGLRGHPEVKNGATVVDLTLDM